MDIIVADSYEAMSQQAAMRVTQLIAQYPAPLICPASGDSPAGLYSQLCKTANENRLDVSGWSFVGLDEWAGMNGGDEGSCRYHLDRQLFRPLNIEEKCICFMDGRADLGAECIRVEEFIASRGGIDVAVVGLGMNGHIGMNEPGTPQSLGTHVANITAITEQTGQKYFKQSRTLTRGITLGLATLMDAKHIVLVVSGKHKADIVRQIFEDAVSERLPATLLRKHPGFVAYLDKDAASLIHPYNS